ncbi:hypothetical protein C8R44DRAFT_944644, partial [Mycena epipterygia]
NGCIFGAGSTAYIVAVRDIWQPDPTPGCRDAGDKMKMMQKEAKGKDKDKEIVVIELLIALRSTKDFRDAGDKMKVGYFINLLIWHGIDGYNTRRMRCVDGRLSAICSWSMARGPSPRTHDERKGKEEARDYLPRCGVVPPSNSHMMANPDDGEEDGKGKDKEIVMPDANQLWAAAEGVGSSKKEGEKQVRLIALLKDRLDGPRMPDANQPKVWAAAEGAGSSKNEGAVFLVFLAA